MRGNGGTWNRAGRRSGGARPMDLTPGLEVTCLGCGTDTPLALLLKRLVNVYGRAVQLSLCPCCQGVLLVDGQPVPRGPG